MERRRRERDAMKERKKVCGEREGGRKEGESEHASERKEKTKYLSTTKDSDGS